MPSARPLGRLSREDDFRRAYREGIRRSTTLLVIHARLNAHDGVRLGLVVGRRFGRAVERNRLRRRLREAVRAYRHQIRPGVDLIVMPRRGAPGATHAELCHAIRQALAAAGVLQDALEDSRVP